MGGVTERPKKYSTKVSQPLQTPVDVEDYADNHWDETLSDHVAQIMEITDDAHILCWNILAPGNGRNNAYRKIESREECEARLTRIAKEIGNYIKGNEALAVTTLQEVPNDQKFQNYFFDGLTKELSENWAITKDFYKRVGSNFGLLTLYNKEKISKTPCIVNLDEELINQKGRILATDMILKNKQSEYSVRVVNAHFRFMDKTNKKIFTPVDAQKEIDAILNSTLGQIVIAADFNQDIQQICIKYQNRCYHSPTATSVSYKLPKEKFCKGRLVSNNIDGFIFKHAPETYFASPEASRQPQVKK